MEQNCIFSTSYISKRLSEHDINQIKDIDNKIQIIEEWKKGIDDKSIYSFSEKELQGNFLQNIFDKVLGYSSLPFNSEFNLLAEQSTKLDASRPDASLGFFDSFNRDVRVVVELKDANCNLDVKQKRSNDNRTPVEQAFSYAPKYGNKCKWVIVSNFIEIRLYLASDELSYESFDISELADKKEFLRFYSLLSKNNLICKTAASPVDNLYDLNMKNELDITKSFYNKFKKLRLELINDITSSNNITPIIAVEKAQKILDRIIFICFCKDSPSELLPCNILSKIFRPDSFLINQTLWQDLKLLFDSIDCGNSRVNISKYNGGLFRKDPYLDSLKISDATLIKLEDISNFNFNSDLNVNILGHIFEQSILDIEHLKNHYSCGIADKSSNIRRQEGIYYTPEHITKYIVSQSIGKWLEDKKAALGYYKLPEISEDEKNIALKHINKNYKKETKTSVIVKKFKVVLEFWKKYREALCNIKIIDISCGSGAFLNQAFLYLYNEAIKINKQINDLYNGQESYFNIDGDMYQEIDKSILQNNIFGVDINKESIEITKLSLWLSTAAKHKCLTTLDDNIICQNSIVYNEDNSDEKNFIWNPKFKSVIDKGGFDIIIGNPPYINSREMCRTMPDVRDFCRRNYKSAKGNWDFFVPFIEKGLNLLKSDGILCNIVPNKLTGSDYSQEIRSMLSEYTILEFKDYSDRKVFEAADVYPIIFTVKKSNKKVPVTIKLFDTNSKKWSETIITEKLFYRDIYWDRYFVRDIRILNIIEKMLSYTPLCKIATVKEAATVSESYKITKYLLNIDEISSIESSYKKLINTGTLDRYVSTWKIKPSKYNKNFYNGPVIEEASLFNVSKIRSIEANSEKIIVGGMCDRLKCYYDNGDYLAVISTSIILDSKIDLKFLLAVLNSKLILFFYKHYFKSTSLNGGYFNIHANQLKKIPIAYEDKIASQIINDVMILLELQGKKESIKEIDRQIDNMIYSLYGLDMNEIDIVENNLRL